MWNVWFLACCRVLPPGGQKKSPGGHYWNCSLRHFKKKRPRRGIEPETDIEWTLTVIFSIWPTVKSAHWPIDQPVHLLVRTHTSCFSFNLWLEFSQTEARLRGEVCPLRVPPFCFTVIYKTPPLPHSLPLLSSTPPHALPCCGCILIYARHRNHSIQPSVCSAVDSC